MIIVVFYLVCFNTQPPEGGWQYAADQLNSEDCFNTQPPEGGWVQIRTILLR